MKTFINKRIIKSSFFDNFSVDAFFTTRDLPLKAGEKLELTKEIDKNKELVCNELNVPLRNLIIPLQTHSSNVEIVELASKNKNQCYENTDALVTNEQDVVLALNFADCVPILFYDPVEKVIAAAHAGWRGTVAKIGPKTVKVMVEKFSCKPENIIAAIGPAIGKCCFEVQEEVMQQLSNSIENGHKEAFLGNHADLKLINKIQLLAGGLKKIDLCEYCTSCQNELFFSYRKEKGKTARHSAAIVLK